MFSIKDRYSCNQGLADAVNFAASQGARIVNLSFGNTTQFGIRICQNEMAPLRSAMASHPELLFVVAAGNSSKNLDENPNYLPPGIGLENALIVGSVTRNSQLSSFSNYGKSIVQVAIGGEDVEGFDLQGRPSRVSGTSYSAPMAAGIASKLLEIRPELTPAEVIEILISTSKKIPALEDKFKAGGVIDEPAALARVR